MISVFCLFTFSTTESNQTKHDIATCLEKHSSANANAKSNSNAIGYNTVQTPGRQFQQNEDQEASEAQR
jgi:hypothetical protein